VVVNNVGRTKARINIFDRTFSFIGPFDNFDEIGVWKNLCIPQLKVY
jgi:hypothetical protein